jgi:LDH2 family malate/lactate/ureidoglycolate dehydrogenase
MLTQGLSGYGRADGPTDWGAAVLVLAIDPQAFGGAGAFLRQTGFIAQACRAARPVKEDSPVRLPGAAGLARKRRALAEGMAVGDDVVAALTELSSRFGIRVPVARAGESGE